MSDIKRTINFFNKINNLLYNRLKRTQSCPHNTQSIKTKKKLFPQKLINQFSNERKKNYFLLFPQNYHQLHIKILSDTKNPRHVPENFSAHKKLQQYFCTICVMCFCVYTEGKNTEYISLLLSWNK